jgi:ABC-2 type transport system permease protein
MNRALWTKALTDASRQFLLSALLLTLFSWLFVWLMSLFPIGGFGMILSLLPGFVEALLGIKLDLLASPVGQPCVLYIDVVTMLVCVGWALGRGSDVVSGEIARGTMDLILSLPVWRVTVLVAHAVVTAVGSLLLAACVHLGIVIGLACVHFQNRPSIAVFLPATLNLFCMVFCFTAITTLASSWGRDRWATIGAAGGFFIFSLIVKMVARMWPKGKLLFSFSFLSAFEPLPLVLTPDAVPHMALRYDLTLLGVGLLCYAVAAVIFSYRDIPGPR